MDAPPIVAESRPMLWKQIMFFDVILGPLIVGTVWELGKGVLRERELWAQLLLLRSELIANQRFRGNLQKCFDTRSLDLILVNPLLSQRFSDEAEACRRLRHVMHSLDQEQRRLMMPEGEIDIVPRDCQDLIEKLLNRITAAIDVTYHRSKWWVFTLSVIPFLGSRVQKFPRRPCGTACLVLKCPPST